HALCAGASVEPGPVAERFLDALAEPPARVQALARLLEDHVRLELRLLGAPAGRDVTDVAAEHPDLTGGRVDEPCESAADGGLAGAALADERERLARPDRERDPVDGVHDVALRPVVLDEVPHLEQRRVLVFGLRAAAAPRHRPGFDLGLLLAAGRTRRAHQVAAVLGLRAG